ncbi:MAG: hypothetical protein JEY94_09245 [Melioribacteraceae bacterium]|nr:hypothetical protein [Melioribacteraceae bacterium]
MLKYVIIILISFILNACFTHHHIPKEELEPEFLNPELEFDQDNFKVSYRKSIYHENPNKMIDKTELIIGTGNFGKVSYSPCNSSISFNNKCEESLFITETDLLTLYNVFMRYELYNTEWQMREFVSNGEIYEEAIFELNGFEYIIPPFLDNNYIVAEEVFTSIREIIPAGTWINIKEEKNNYYKNNLNRRLRY